MSTRHASCSCGQLRLEVEGDPIRISLCHCLACQRRTGSAFAVQARFTSDRVHVAGRFSEYVRLSDDGGEERVFRFCPDCGATVFYTTADAPDVIAVPVGAFADPAFPPPSISFYESRRHPWVGLPVGIERDDVWAALRPLYESGEYALVADRGRELIEAHPEYAELLYNVACCESLAGRTEDALEHLRRAIDGSEQLRSLAADDSDFDPIRGEAAFRQLVR
ncbi:MAG: GFA family protein [Actinobacteria bacterium]|nr:GFA family protein [Actinomycetota bacterium]